MIQARLWAESYDPHEAVASLRRQLHSDVWAGFEKASDITLTLKRSRAIPTTWRAACTIVGKE